MHNLEQNPEALCTRQSVLISRSAVFQPGRAETPSLCPLGQLGDFKSVLMEVGVRIADSEFGEHLARSYKS